MIQVLKTPKEIIAENIRYHREARMKWTQDKASEVTDVPKRTYQRAEDPRANTDVLTLTAIANGFGLDLWTLFIDRSATPEVRPAPTVEALVKNNEQLVKVIEEQERRIQELESQIASLSPVKRELLVAISSINDEEASMLLGFVRDARSYQEQALVKNKKSKT